MSLKIMYFLIFRKDDFGAILGPFGVHFGPLVVLLGRPWGALGGLGGGLGRSRVLLGLPWVTLGRSRGSLGVHGRRLWDPFWAMRVRISSQC